jgi:hypothetical protein
MHTDITCLPGYHKSKNPYFKCKHPVGEISSLPLAIVEIMTTGMGSYRLMLHPRARTHTHKVKGKGKACEKISTLDTIDLKL